VFRVFQGKGAKAQRPSGKAAGLNNDESVQLRVSEAASRALAEAEERRRATGKQPVLPEEVNGREGPEPIRYGDWEVRGIATDF